MCNWKTVKYDMNNRKESDNVEKVTGVWEQGNVSEILKYMEIAAYYLICTFK